MSQSKAQVLVGLEFGERAAHVSRPAQTSLDIGKGCSCERLDLARAGQAEHGESVGVVPVNPCCTLVDDPSEHVGAAKLRAVALRTSQDHRLTGEARPTSRLLIEPVVHDHVCEGRHQSLDRVAFELTVVRELDLIGQSVEQEFVLAKVARPSVVLEQRGKHPRARAVLGRHLAKQLGLGRRGHRVYEWLHASGTTRRKSAARG